MRGESLSAEVVLWLNLEGSTSSYAETWTYNLLNPVTSFVLKAGFDSFF